MGLAVVFAEILDGLLGGLQGRLGFLETLAGGDVRSYPCRSFESATKLAECFIAGVTKPRLCTMSRYAFSR
jgi:hypothetical protein